jgi:hypothetical protein
MKGTNLVRWSALAAMACGALWIAGGLLHLAYPQDPPGALGHYLNYLGPPCSAPPTWAYWVG